MSKQAVCSKIAMLEQELINNPTTEINTEIERLKQEAKKKDSKFNYNIDCVEKTTTTKVPTEATDYIYNGGRRGKKSRRNSKKRKTLRKKSTRRKTRRYKYYFF
jgi:hypothetical protein